MKSYTITVNGTSYEVTVEENGAVKGQTQKVVEKQVVKEAPKANGEEGSIKVAASVPGKIVKIEAKVGDTVKAGATIVILESMKMEIPVVAPKDGTVVSIDVAEGDSIENGDTLATMNE